MKTANATSPHGTVPALELVRGLAAFDVFLYHFFLHARIPHGPLVTLLAWGPQAVIIFLVLSGYVIGLSQQRKARGPVEFLKARVKRIYPIYLIAIGIALVVAGLIGEEIRFWPIVGHLFFLQSYSGAVVERLRFDGPLWSLGTEFQFYMIFAGLLFFRGTRPFLVWWWLAVIALILRHSGFCGVGTSALVLETLSLSPCWLMGYFASSWRGRYSLTLSQALVLFFMIPMTTRCDFAYAVTNEDDYDVVRCFLQAMLTAPLLHTLAVRYFYPEAKPMAGMWPWIGAVYLSVGLYATLHGTTTLSSMLVWLALPVVTALAGLAWQVSGWRRLIDGPWMTKVSLFLGGASYAIYAIHFPLILLVIRYTSNHLLQFAILVPLIGVVALFLEYVVQPRAAAWLDRLWSRRETLAELPLVDR